MDSVLVKSEDGAASASEEYYIEEVRYRCPGVKALEDAIAEFGTWWHYLMNVWIVDTDMTVDQMNEKLLKCLSPKDDLLIIGIQEPYQGWLPEEAWKWLNKKMEDKRLAAAR